MQIEEALHILNVVRLKCKLKHADHLKAEQAFELIKLKALRPDPISTPVPHTD